jgi:hypothetical protein
MFVLSLLLSSGYKVDATTLVEVFIVAVHPLHLLKQLFLLTLA